MKHTAAVYLWMDELERAGDDLEAYRMEMYNAVDEPLTADQLGNIRVSMRQMVRTVAMLKDALDEEEKQPRFKLPWKK